MIRIIVELIGLHCSRIGCHVVSAYDSMTALRLIEAHLPDVVILDVEMPCGSGLCVREMMANHEKLRSIPVIILTGSKNQETVRRCHKLMSYYIPKCPDVWARIEPVIRELVMVRDEQNNRLPQV